MEEQNIRALPRSMEQLGRCYDCREFWTTFGIMPVRSRIQHRRVLEPQPVSRNKVLYSTRETIGSIEHCFEFVSLFSKLFQPLAMTNRDPCYLWPLLCRIFPNHFVSSFYLENNQLSNQIRSQQLASWKLLSGSIGWSSNATSFRHVCNLSLLLRHARCAQSFRKQPKKIYSPK